MRRQSWALWAGPRPYWPQRGEHFLLTPGFQPPQSTQSAMESSLTLALAGHRAGHRGGMRDTPGVSQLHSLRAQPNHTAAQPVGSTLLPMLPRDAAKCYLGENQAPSVPGQE